MYLAGRLNHMFTCTDSAICGSLKSIFNIWFCCFTIIFLILIPLNYWLRWKEQTAQILQAWKVVYHKTFHFSQSCLMRTDIYKQWEFGDLADTLVMESHALSPSSRDVCAVSRWLDYIHGKVTNISYTNQILKSIQWWDILS